MFGRAVVVTGNPGKLDEGIDYIRGEVMPAVDAQPGSRGLGMWVNRGTGQVVVNTVWDDAAAESASDEQLRPLREEAMRRLGATNARIQRLEPAVFVQTRPNVPGDWTRASQIQHRRERLEADVSAFADEVLPLIQQIPGVATVGLLVDRTESQTVLNVTYDSAEAFEASRTAADRLRTDIVQRYGAELLDVMELQVALVGIRPPMDLPAQEGPVDMQAAAPRRG